MKKVFGMFSFLVLLLTLPNLYAQQVRVRAGAAGSHTTTISWTGSTTAGANYNVWRAPCSAAIAAGICPAASEGSFAKLTATALSTTTLTYADSSVVGNTNYSYYITGICPAGACAANFAVNADSAPSNHVGAAIPPDPVGPPSGLTLTNVASNHQGSNENVYVSWSDTPGSTNTYALTNKAAKTLLTGQAYSLNGAFWMQWAGSSQTGLSLKVCDLVPACQTWPIS